MRILLTGVTGTCGGYLLEWVRWIRRAEKTEARRLLQEATLRVAVRTEEKAVPFRAMPEVDEVVLMDMADAESCKAAAKGVDRFFIVLTIVLNCMEMAENMFSAIKSEAPEAEMIVKIAEWVRLESFFETVFYQTELKLEARVEELMGAGRVTRLHPTNFMQNFDKFFGFKDQVAKGGTFSLGWEDKPATFVEGRDIARAACYCLSLPLAQAKEEGIVGGTYTLSSVLMNGEEACKVFSEVLGKEVQYKALTPAEMDKRRVGTAPDWVNHVLLKLDEAIVVGGGGFAEVFPDVTDFIAKGSAAGLWDAPTRPFTFKEYVENNKDRF